MTQTGVWYARLITNFMSANTVFEMLLGSFHKVPDLRTRNFVLVEQFKILDALPSVEQRRELVYY